jgi:hypothetical protein
MPRETIGINLSIDVHEAVAAFFAAVAHPGANEREERAMFCTALIRDIFRRAAARSEEFAATLIPMRAASLLLSDQDEKKALKKGLPKFDKRLAAARMIIPRLRQLEEGTLPKVHGFRATQNSMASLLADEVGWKEEIGDPRNVKTRVFRPSRPVIHAAVALADWIQGLGREGIGDGKHWTLERFLIHPNELRWVVERAEQVRLQLPSLRHKQQKKQFTDDETIQFVLA